jgi:imidazolonepropionase-like amidohydrolase
MRHSRKQILSALLLALAASGLWLAAGQGAGAQRRRGGGGADVATTDANAGVNVYAITGARIVTVSSATIERGTIVIRDGLIAAVGANVAAPPDARPIDGTGLTVYPGLIDASSTLGIPRPTPTPGAAGGQAGLAALLFGQSAPSATSPNSTQLPGLQPEILASDILRPGGPEIEAARNAGITSAQTVPRGNVFLGQSAVINLAGDTPQAMIVRSPVALYIGLNPIGGGQYPGSLMGVFSSVRQMLLDARRYREANEIYERNPRGLRRPEQDKSLAALLPVLDRRMPVVMQADRAREIDRALDLAQEFNLQMIINGGQEADRVAARLKALNVPVLLSLNFPRRTAAASSETDPEPLRVLRERVEALKTAGRLAAAGVRFAFQSGGMTAMSDFLANAARAVDNGLPRDEAVRALTLRPAEILGVSNQLGSIEVGKIANLIVTRGDLLARDRRITQLFIDGRQIELRPAATSTGGANASGTWSLTINLAGSGNEKQEFGVTLTLQQQGERLSGSLQGQLGSGTIANGTISGGDINFTVPITLPAPASQTTDAIFSGTVTGGEMRGTVQIVGRGSGSFVGTRAGGPPPSGTTPQSTPPPAGTQPPAATGTPPSGAAASLSGTWALTSSFGQRQTASTLTLEQQGDRLSGRIEGRTGTNEITDGSVNGNSFRFTTNATFGGQTVSLTYEGTVSGNQMSGTVTTPRGSIPFSGTRTP